MGRASVSRTLNASTEAVWGLVRDFGNVPWMPGGENAETEGQGPGMVRILQGPNGAIREQLESVDDEARVLVYSIPENVPFPVTGYRSTMTVSDDGGQGHLDWSCEFEPEGISEEEAAKTVETMYGVMFGWIEDSLSS